MSLIFILNLFSSFFLCGLIWTVQIVHYPYFIYTDETKFSNAMTFHKKRVSYIVIPVMFTELLTSFWLVFNSAEQIVFHAAGLVVVLLIWLITFLLQVPLHSSLTSQYNSVTIQQLVRSNWWRTLLWSLKSVIGVLLLTKFLI